MPRYDNQHAWNFTQITPSVIWAVCNIQSVMRPVLLFQEVFILLLSIMRDVVDPAMCQMICHARGKYDYPSILPGGSRREGLLRPKLDWLVDRLEGQASWPGWKDDTFENTHWRKVKLIQPVSLQASNLRTHLKTHDGEKLTGVLWRRSPKLELLGWRASWPG